MGIAPGGSTVCSNCWMHWLHRQQDSHCVFLFKDLIHGMHGCLTAASCNWEVPATSWMSIPMMMALPIMQQTVSPTPIGRTAGFYAMSQQAMNGARPCGSTMLQDASTCTCSYYCHTINEAFLKEVHIQHHPFESTPDGPAFLFEEKQSRSFLHLLIQTM